MSKSRSVGAVGVKPRSEEGRKRSKSLADFLKDVVGEYVTVVSRNGVVYEGYVAGKDHGFLILRDAVVRGSKYVARVQVVLIKPDTIQHIHSKPLELKEVQPE